VFTGIFGLSDRILRRFRQHRHYRAISRFPAAISHGVGFAGFRYENLLLSRLAPAERAHRNVLLPGRIGFLAACGFTLAPFRFEGREIWIGNTHLHSFNPRARARQAESIAAEIKKLGDVPVVFLGDLNTVPPGCRETGFPAGERDARSYKNDRTLAILTDAGLVTIPHEDRRRFYTYPTGVPNRTLDYVLHSRHFEVVSYRVIRTFRLSDHYPVRAELRLR
jgi:endonuclease/exonuclease/phosphatase family metal-dependent hydrolase